jgi:hypothetical protein
MLAVSGRWAASLRQNHTPIHRVELWRTSTLLIPDVPIESASVTKDASQSPRTTASVQVADTSSRVAQLMTPFGNRLRFYKGLKYPDNTTEMVRVADLDIVGSNLSKGAETTLSVECADPAQRIGEDSPIRPAPPARWRGIGSRTGTRGTRSSSSRTRSARSATSPPAGIPCCVRSRR